MSLRRNPQKNVIAGMLVTVTDHKQVNPAPKVLKIDEIPVPDSDDLGSETSSGSGSDSDSSVLFRNICNPSASPSSSVASQEGTFLPFEPTIAPMFELSPLSSERRLSSPPTGQQAPTCSSSTLTSPPNSHKQSSSNVMKVSDDYKSSSDSSDYSQSAPDTSPDENEDDIDGDFTGYSLNSQQNHSSFIEDDIEDPIIEVPVEVESTKKPTKRQSRPKTGKRSRGEISSSSKNPPETREEEEEELERKAKKRPYNKDGFRFEDLSAEVQKAANLTPEMITAFNIFIGNVCTDFRMRASIKSLLEKSPNFMAVLMHGINGFLDSKNPLVTTSTNRWTKLKSSSEVNASTSEDQSFVLKEYPMLSLLPSQFLPKTPSVSFEAEKKNMNQLAGELSKEFSDFVTTMPSKKYPIWRVGFIDRKRGSSHPLAYQELVGNMKWTNVKIRAQLLSANSKTRKGPEDMRWVSDMALLISDPKYIENGGNVNNSILPIIPNVPVDILKKITPMPVKENPYLQNLLDPKNLTGFFIQKTLGHGPLSVCVFHLNPLVRMECPQIVVQEGQNCIVHFVQERHTPQFKTVLNPITVDVTHKTKTFDDKPLSIGYCSPPQNKKTKKQLASFCDQELHISRPLDDPSSPMSIYCIKGVKDFQQIVLNQGMNTKLPRQRQQSEPIGLIVVVISKLPVITPQN